MNSGARVAPISSPPMHSFGAGRSMTSVLIKKFDELAIVAVWIVFLSGISRIGLAVVPEYTQVAWLGAYVVTALAILQRPNIYLALVRRNLIFIFASLFCICSGLWSYLPSLTAYSGVLLLLNTLVGFAIAERIGMARTITILFSYFFVMQVISVILLKLNVYWAFDEMGNAKGLYLHKNAMALNANSLYLTALVLFSAGWRRFLSAIGIAVGLAGIYLSGSGTGLLLGAFGTSVLIACAIAAPGHRSSLFFGGFFLVVASSAAAFLLLSDYNVEGAVLHLLGKDATLTGRTILWDQALKSFSDYPWLGIGYNSFWYSTDTAASSIWLVVGQRLMSFHNIYLDRLVDVGAVGCAIFVAILVVLLWRTARYFLSTRTAIAAWPFVYVCFITVDSLSEFPVFWNSEFQLILAVVAAATCGVRLDHGRPDTESRMVESHIGNEART